MTKTRIETIEDDELLNLKRIDGATVDELVEWATQVRGLVPPEHRAEGMVSLLGSREDYPAVDLYYLRPETPEDVANDEKLARQRARQHEKNEREQLARLKAKYEGGAK